LIIKKKFGFFKFKELIAISINVLLNTLISGLGLLKKDFLNLLPLPANGIMTFKDIR